MSIKKVMEYLKIYYDVNVATLPNFTNKYLQYNVIV